MVQYFRFFFFFLVSYITIKVVRGGGVTKVIYAFKIEMVQYLHIFS